MHCVVSDIPHRTENTRFLRYRESASALKVSNPCLSALTNIGSLQFVMWALVSPPFHTLANEHSHVAREGTIMSSHLQLTSVELFIVNPPQYLHFVF
jgi:hypothetical protein